MKLLRKMSFIVYDNRALPLSVALNSNVNFEIEAGMSLFITLCNRLINQCFSINKELFFENLWGIFIPQNSERANFYSWKNVSILDLADLISSRISISNNSYSYNSWSGLMSNVLDIIKFRQNEFSFKDNYLSISFLSNDIALFGVDSNRKVDSDSLVKFKERLIELGKILNLTIECTIICVNISKRIANDNSNELDSLICVAKNVLLNSSEISVNLHIMRMENSVIYFDSLLRKLIHSSKKNPRCILEFPNTTSFKGSLYLEISSVSINSFLHNHEGLSEIYFAHLLPQNFINPVTLDGYGMIVRPASLQSPSRLIYNHIYLLSISL